MRSLSKTKASGNCIQIQRINIKHFFDIVSGIRVQIRFECTDSLSMQIIILTNQKLEILLNILEFFFFKLVLVQLNFSLKEMFQIIFLLLQ